MSSQGRAGRAGHVLLEHWRRHLFELRGHACDLVHVRSALQAGEHRVVDLHGELLPVKDHARARPPQRLVRRGRDDIGEGERGHCEARGHQTRDVRHVAHEQRAARVGDLAEAGIVPLARVGGAAADDHGGLEQVGLSLQGVVVDDACGGVRAVGQRLKVDRGGGHGLAAAVGLRVGVKSVGQVTSRRKVQTHDSVVRLQQRRQHFEVGGRATVGLHIYAPLLVVEGEGSQCACLAQRFNHVDVLSTTVISLAGQALGILVGQSTAQALNDRLGREVLARNELQAAPLTPLFLLDDVEYLGVVLLQGHRAGDGSGDSVNHGSHGLLLLIRIRSAK